MKGSKGDSQSLSFLSIRVTLQKKSIVNQSIALLYKLTEGWLTAPGEPEQQAYMDLITLDFFFKTTDDLLIDKHHLKLRLAS